MYGIYLNALASGRICLSPEITLLSLYFPSAPSRGAARRTRLPGLYLKSIQPCDLNIAFIAFILHDRPMPVETGDQRSIDPTESAMHPPRITQHSGWCCRSRHSRCAARRRPWPARSKSCSSAAARDLGISQSEAATLQRIAALELNLTASEPATIATAVLVLGCVGIDCCTDVPAAIKKARCVRYAPCLFFRSTLFNQRP